MFTFIFSGDTAIIPEMEEITAGGKQLYIVHSHNQVLEAWEQHPGRNIFSLDYHTDTKEAFGSYSYWRADSEAKAGRCEDPELRKRELQDEKIRAYLEGTTTIRSINDNLKHDEHIDFAVRTDMIGTAFILATNSNVSSSNPHVFIADGRREYEGQRIIEYSSPCLPDSPNLRADSVIEDEFLSDAVATAESFHPLFFNDFILDIDCDYFNTVKSLRPENSQLFKKLIRKAAFITIALEPECVRICRLDDSLGDSETILDALISIIGSI